MEIKITDRISEAVKGIDTLTADIKEYQLIVSCLDALREVHSHPEKYTYSKEDETKVIDKLSALCQKHEILLPSYTEWANLELR